MLTEMDIYVSSTNSSNGNVMETTELVETTCGVYPVFWTVKNNKILASSSALALIKKLGNFEANTKQKWVAENWPFHPDSLDKRVKRLLPFSRVEMGFGGSVSVSTYLEPANIQTDVDWFVDTQAKLIQEWVTHVEDVYPNHTHVVLTGGKDSLMAFLVKHKNPRNWVAYSAQPNTALVKKFFKENNLNFYVYEDNGEDPEHEEFIKEKIIATDGLVNPWHYRFIESLRNLKTELGPCVFWMGTWGDALNSPSIWKRKLKNNFDFYNFFFTRGSRWQGAYHQAIKNLLGVPCFSLYHSPDLWSKVFMRYDPSIVKNLDVRDMLATKFTQHGVIWPDKNPGPKTYINQKKTFNEVVDVYLGEVP